MDYIFYIVIILLQVLLFFFLFKLRKKEEPDVLSPLISKAIGDGIDRIDKSLKDESTRNREEANSNARHTREELSNSFKNFGDSLFSKVVDISRMQKEELNKFSDQLSKLTQMNEQKMEQLREKVELRLKELQESNSQKLEEMRATVDEKLQSTLEKRLGESFKLVSDRLELVHKGLGEMQTLASGVGDLKKVLTNIKTRGGWGEMQLGNLIEQLLTIEQYEKNVATKKGSNDKVEYAVKLPGKDELGEVVWLPIDAKFPVEDYQRLLEAQELANLPLVEEAAKGIESRIRLEAKNIADKYLDPPNTTDFAIMFLPIEGLYAEVLRRPGLAEKIQREHRVVLAGPTTLAALLNSLQMGFRTLAIEKRSSEVWKLLGAVKTDFSKFGEVLEKTKKKLQEASNTIDSAATASRRIERKLRDVQELPSADAVKLIDTDADTDE